MSNSSRNKQIATDTKRRDNQAEGATAPATPSGEYATIAKSPTPEFYSPKFS